MLLALLFFILISGYNIDLSIFVYIFNLDSEREREMYHVYKSHLQTYALKQNLDLPVYATEREGPPHAPRFKCKVTFCGQTFQSQEFFPTLKSAEHAAAKIALASLVPQNQEASSPPILDILLFPFQTFFFLN